MERGNNGSGSETQGIPSSSSHGQSSSLGETAAPAAELHISSRKYTIPFGRYEGSDRAPAPAHESMIGRIRQRARLLNLLFTQGRRGAYLITGHRGAGKTSFVEDAIATYRRDVFRRFLRSLDSRPGAGFRRLAAQDPALAMGRPFHRRAWSSISILDNST